MIALALVLPCLLLTATRFVPAWISSVQVEIEPIAITSAGLVVVCSLAADYTDSADVRIIADPEAPWFVDPLLRVVDTDARAF